jgi:hypothetical protein
MNEELKQILTGAIIFIVIIAVVMFLNGSKNDRDVTSPDGYYNSGREIEPIE